MRSVFSGQFDYNKVDFILVCDGNYYEDKDIGGIGWVLIDKNNNCHLFEGYDTKNINSTIESEYVSIREGLSESLLYGCSNSDTILIWTDYIGIVSDFKNSRRRPYKSEIKSLLSNFKSWGIEKVDRSKVKTAHCLADYAINNN